MTERLHTLPTRHSKVIAALDEFGDVSHAAQALGMTTTAVLRAVNEARELLEDRLFDNAPTGLIWTTRGVSAVVRAHASLHDAMGGARGANLDHNTYAIGTTRLCEAVVTASVPHALLEQGTGISIRRGEFEPMLESLENGVLDVVFGRCAAGFRHPEFDYRPVYRDRFVAVCGKDHPLWRKREVSLETLAAQDWVLPPDDTYARHAFDQAFLAARLAPPKPAVVSWLAQGDVAMMESHSLLGLFPETEVFYIQQAGTLRAIGDLKMAYQEVGAILRRAPAQPAATTVAIQALERYVRVLKATET